MNHPQIYPTNTNEYQRIYLIWIRLLYKIKIIIMLLILNSKAINPLKKFILIYDFLSVFSSLIYYYLIWISIFFVVYNLHKQNCIVFVTFLFFSLISFFTTYNLSLYWSRNLRSFLRFFKKFFFLHLCNLFTLLKYNSIHIYSHNG